jgi:hypothetical protein
VRRLIESTLAATHSIRRQPERPRAVQRAGPLFLIPRQRTGGNDRLPCEPLEIGPRNQPPANHDLLAADQTAAGELADADTRHAEPLGCLDGLKTFLYIDFCVKQRIPAQRAPGRP